MIAEIANGFAPYLTTIQLQWGRDQMIAEIKVDILNQRIEFVASMGPRSNDRGNLPVYHR